MFADPYPEQFPLDARGALSLSQLNVSAGAGAGLNAVFLMLLTRCAGTRPLHDSTTVIQSLQRHCLSVTALSNS